MNTSAQHQQIDPGRLDAILDRVRGLDVWVVGDIILDEYIVGETNRVSPEAPVPVVRVEASSQRLGGAANVASQITMLGARASLAGVIGQDAAADDILGLCAGSGIDTRAVQRLAGRPSCRKLRVLARQQQLVRLDWEETGTCPAGTGQAILERLKAGPAPGVVILSDYAKGLLPPNSSTPSSTRRPRTACP